MENPVSDQKIIQCEHERDDQLQVKSNRMSHLFHCIIELYTCSRCRHIHFYQFSITNTEHHQQNNNNNAKDKKTRNYLKTGGSSAQMVRFVCTQDHTLHRRHSRASLHCVLKCVNTFTLSFLSVYFSKNKTAYTVKQENRQISTSLLFKTKQNKKILWKSVCTHSSSAQHFDTGTTSITSIGEAKKKKSVKD